MPVTLDELRKVQTSVSDAELARAKAQVKASVLMSLESTGSRCEQLARQIQVFGRVLSTEETVPEDPHGRPHPGGRPTRRGSPLPQQANPRGDGPRQPCSGSDIDRRWTRAGAITTPELDRCPADNRMITKVGLLVATTRSVIPRDDRVDPAARHGLQASDRTNRSTPAPARSCDHSARAGGPNVRKVAVLLNN